jgi:response regulator RpfG family c-di-GMP phosphodiesterase
MDIMTPKTNAVLLCVDDDPCVLTALRRLFRAEPFRVVTATNAAQALSSLRHDPVEVIIADERMPGASGSEFLAEVRQRWPWVGRIILTAFPEHVAAMRGLDAGVDVLVHKPWNDEELRRTVRRLLREVERERLEPTGGGLLGRRVVVLVDDDPETLSALRRSLRREPYQVLSTVRPEEALDWVCSRDVSVVVTDQRMPGMTGTELAEKVYVHSPSTARILLTGHAPEIATAPELRHQVEYLIAKPWDDAMLRQALRSILCEREVEE